MGWLFKEPDDDKPVTVGVYDATNCITMEEFSAKYEVVGRDQDGTLLVIERLDEMPKSEKVVKFLLTLLPF